MSYKLPIYNITINAFSFAWTNRKECLKVLSLPITILVIIDVLRTSFLELDEHIFEHLILLIILGIVWSLFSVTCHRLILVADKYIHFRITMRELKLLAWIVGLTIIFMILAVFSLSIGMYMVDSSFNFWLYSILAIPSYYTLGRLSLVMPATAVDRKVDLKWSWSKTNNNGWRMFVVAGLFPWLFSAAYVLAYHEEATFVVKVIAHLISYISVAIGIFALSIAYKKLENQSDIKVYME